jgi:ribosomal protein L40E
VTAGEPATTERRCPSCGGLVGADAEWCGQCFTRLDRMREDPVDAPPNVGPPPAEPAGTPEEAEGVRARTAPASAEGTGIRVEGDVVVWDCPRCGTENPIEAGACRACGAPFGRLFEPEEAPPRVPPGRAVARSLVFPGLGHAAVGRTAEGWARGVVFAYAAVSVVAILVMRAGSGLGPFLALFVLSVLAAVAFYALAAIDAGRLAGGEPQILSPRGLLYGAAALILLTVIVLVVIGVRASGQGG